MYNNAGTSSFPRQRALLKLWKFMPRCTIVEHKIWCPLQNVHISSLKRPLWWEPSYNVSWHLVSSDWSNVQNNALRWLLRFYISSQVFCWPLLCWQPGSKQHKGWQQALQEALEANWLKFRDQGIVHPEFLHSILAAHCFLVVIEWFQQCMVSERPKKPLHICPHGWRQWYSQYGHGRTGFWGGKMASLGF